ncbi:oxidoreductase [Adlercreutzia sp. R25]|uniref:Oxidoreductase n=1 Tax=Adlercreutzia shanghongiae TaxID=3111773 RepID=A0ABU6IYF9_9ACTN|nr:MULTISPECIES: oxidoreductase [unclassified Adlercreutzia]MEC4271870.1 oxidoreductase [Adlercreutzia sp. R25]MEC4294873.1 oxidoreductase [Adlercreutzia sp. R22]
MRNGLLIDYEWCTHCHSCEVACKEEHGIPVGQWGIHLHDEGPWEKDDGKMNWFTVPVPTDLCDLCESRVSEGREPTCVHHCLASCMKFGPVDELAKELEKKPRQVLFVPR